MLDFIIVGICALSLAFGIVKEGCCADREPIVPTYRVPADFVIPYEALKDTLWRDDISKTEPKTGILKKGMKVFLNYDAAPHAIWQLASMPDGAFIFVLCDFKKAAPTK